MISYFGRAGEFLKARGNMLAWGLLVVAIIALVAAIWHRQSVKTSAENELAFTNLVLQPDPKAKPEDRIRALDAQLTKESSEFRAAAICNAIGNQYSFLMVVSKTDADRKTNADKASEYFQRTIRDYPKQKIEVALAHIGMARAAETIGELDKAKAQYDAVIGMTDLANYPVAKIAEEGKAQLEQLRQPVKFATTAPTSSPASASAPASGPISAAARAVATRPASAPASDKADK